MVAAVASVDPGVFTQPGLGFTTTQRAPMATDIPLETGRQTASLAVTVVWELR